MSDTHMIEERIEYTTQLILLDIEEMNNLANRLILPETEIPGPVIRNQLLADINTIFNIAKRIKRQTDYVRKLERKQAGN